uniref:Major vault protein n=1 Tax=Chrysemys picta bellii TaxID=8478 RepID=A0A8C3HFT1_CHRPI
MAEESIIRIPPHHYIHVLDQNSNVTRVEVGPQTYIRQDNERVVFPPAKMVTVPPRHYCAVLNPVLRAPGAGVQFDASGQALLRHADLEIRLSQPPFPLYPGEEIQQGITALQVVLPDTALHLKALLDFEDDQGEKYVAGDEFLFEGPGTYIPRTEVEVVEISQATVIRHNQAIRLRARKECTDREGTRRVTGTPPSLPRPSLPTRSPLPAPPQTAALLTPDPQPPALPAPPQTAALLTPDPQPPC